MDNVPTRTSLEIPLFVGETVLSVEHRNGLVITTTVKVEVEDKAQSRQTIPTTSAAADANALPDAAAGPVIAPDSNDKLAYPSDAESEQSMVVVDSHAPLPPNSVRSGLPGLSMVPVPTELRHPLNDTVFSKYVVVFAGLRVGIFPCTSSSAVWWKGCPMLVVSNWDSALWHYAAAYQGVFPFCDGMHNDTPGYQHKILKVTAIENPLAATYMSGTGPKVWSG
ncbi:hypothetical protein V5O48_009260 [Marasmius crinis-equi]|uniref:Uncharacterized protein n=1 Tax=Marasmius crinis-equi TaxID=585013 RepID=A0ABR3FC63_9AGAR